MSSPLPPSSHRPPASIGSRLFYPVAILSIIGGSLYIARIITERQAKDPRNRGAKASPSPL